MATITVTITMEMPTPGWRGPEGPSQWDLKAVGTMMSNPEDYSEDSEDTVCVKVIVCGHL